MRKLNEIMLVHLLAALYILPGAGAADDRAEFEVFPLVYADPAAAREAAEALVGETGTVILDRTNQRLLVRAEPMALEQLRSLLAELNTPPRNVYIEVRFLEDHATRERRAAVDVDGGLVIVNREPSGRLRLRPSVAHRSERGRQDTRESLLVASGREGVLRVGERVPWLQWINRWGIRHGIYTSEIVWQDVGASLIVRPTVIGDGPLVHIRLIPELSGRVDGQPFAVRYATAATEVTVADGNTVDLGGLSQSNEFYSRFLVGFDDSDGHRNLRIQLTPRLSAP